MHLLVTLLEARSQGASIVEQPTCAYPKPHPRANRHAGRQCGDTATAAHEALRRSELLDQAEHSQRTADAVFQSAQTCICHCLTCTHAASAAVWPRQPMLPGFTTCIVFSNAG